MFLSVLIVEEVVAWNVLLVVRKDPGRELAKSLETCLREERGEVRARRDHLHFWDHGFSIFKAKTIIIDRNSWKQTNQYPGWSEQSQ